MLILLLVKKLVFCFLDSPRVRSQRDRTHVPLKDQGILSDASRGGDNDSDDEEVSPSISSILFPEASSPNAITETREREIRP